MKFYIFIQNNKIIGAGQAEILNDDIEAIEVSEEIYNAYCQDNDKVIYDVEKHEVIFNPNYEQVLYKRREEKFNKEFFETSSGYIRRKATMKDGSQKDFISDLIPLMGTIENVPIIAYDKPDFSKEVTEEVLVGLQKVVKSTPELVQECKNQAIIDFYGFNPINLLQQQENEDAEEIEE